MVGAGTAQLLRHQHAHEAELTHRRDSLARKARFAIPFGGMGCQLLAGEVARGVPDQDLLFA